MFLVMFFMAILSFICLLVVFGFILFKWRLDLKKETRQNYSLLGFGYLKIMSKYKELFGDTRKVEIVFVYSLLYFAALLVLISFVIR